MGGTKGRPENIEPEFVALLLNSQLFSRFILYQDDITV